MANDRLHGRPWGEDLQGTQLRWPFGWGGAAAMTEQDSSLAGASTHGGWLQADDGCIGWPPHQGENKCADVRLRCFRRTRAWIPKGPPPRGRRTKIRGRGRDESTTRHPQQGWYDHDHADAAGSSGPVCDLNKTHDDVSPRREGKMDCEGVEPSVATVDGESQGRREENNADVPAAGECPEIEFHISKLQTMVKQMRSTFKRKEQESDNLYKRARTEAEKELKHCVDVEQQLFNVHNENERLKAETASLRTELESEKKSCLTWRERLMKHEGKVGKLQTDINELSGVRNENIRLMGDLDVARAQLQIEQGKSTQLQERLTNSESTLKALQHTHDSVARDLHEEKEKALCQICMDRPRDTCSLPCVHLNYCSQCLLKHLETSKTCPACRTPTSGTLQTSLYTIT